MIPLLSIRLALFFDEVILNIIILNTLQIRVWNFNSWKCGVYYDQFVHDQMNFQSKIYRIYQVCNNSRCHDPAMGCFKCRKLTSHIRLTVDSIYCHRKKNIAQAWFCFNSSTAAACVNNTFRRSQVTDRFKMYSPHVRSLFSSHWFENANKLVHTFRLLKSKSFTKTTQLL